MLRTSSPITDSRQHSFTSKIPPSTQVLTKISEFKLVASTDGGVLLDLKNDLAHKLTPIGVEMLRAMSRGRSDADTVTDLSIRFDISKVRIADALLRLQKRLAELGLQMPMDYPLEEAVTPISLNHALPNFPWYGRRKDHTIARTRFSRTIQAFVGLLVFDCILKCSSFKVLCRIVRRWPVRQKSIADESKLVEEICIAVERACPWYSKKALCLQRSAVTACLLRSSGLRAEMVIGTQIMPFAPHAWVEVDGTVVNDHKPVKRVFAVLDRY